MGMDIHAAIIIFMSKYLDKTIDMYGYIHRYIHRYPYIYLDIMDINIDIYIWISI